MITVTQAVSDMLTRDDIAREALIDKVLNFSAYADKIHKEIEKITFKEVKRGTLVVSLARLAKSYTTSQHPLKPHITIQSLSVKAPLCALTYDKTADTQRRVSVLNPFQISISDLFGVVESNSEITLICTEKAKSHVKTHMGDQIKAENDGLVAVTAHFDKAHVDEPNFHYALFSSLASKRIPIVEVISTYTEVSFLVQKNDMEEVVKTLNIYS